MPDNVLVTGATGFIGSALCRTLVEHDHVVRALHRKTSSLSSLEGLDLERIQGDILEPESLVPAMKGVDLVFHAAAQSDYWRQPQLVFRTIVEGTQNVIRAAIAAGVRRVILTSSIAAMGIPKKGELLTETHTTKLPADYFPYGHAKWRAEIEALSEAQGGVELVIVNPTIVLGPGDVNRISGSMVIEAARGWGFFWLDGGANYVHILDVVDGHLAASRRGTPGERYILGGENLSNREAFTILTEIAGRRPPWLKIPTLLIEPAAKVIDWLHPVIKLPFNSAQLRLVNHDLFCDLSKSRSELGLVEPRSFRQAAREAYDWYRDQGVI